MGLGAKSYMRKGFLIYEEMHNYFHHIWGGRYSYMTLHPIPLNFLIYEEICKYLAIYEEVVIHIWFCNRSIPTLYMRKIWFSFLSVHKRASLKLGQICSPLHLFVFFSLFASKLEQVPTAK
jgi:hypothetical protein